MQNVDALSPPVKPLRDYQVSAIEDVREAMRRSKRTVLVIPTGGGKTRIGAEVVRSALAKGKRVVWLAHRTELIDQTCATLHEYGLTVGAVAASSPWPINRIAPVQVCSIQTLCARDTVRPPADLIVWDEAHHASPAAEEWASILTAYESAFMLGLTATPERGDGAGLAPLFTGIVVGATVRKLTTDGWLVPCEVFRPKKLLEPNHIAMDPLEAYRANAMGQQGLLFAKTVAEAQSYSDAFNAAGIRSVCIHAKTPEIERSAAISAFRSGAVRILHNVYIFTEGTDLPMASCCILARGASTPGIFLQMVGRVLRPHPGKKSAILIDLRGISHVHGMPEDERVYKLDGKGIALVKLTLCKVCQAELGDGYPCAQCGYSPDASDGVDPTRIDSVPLEKYARKIAEGPAQRRETLVRWLHAARFKGHKLASVRFKWRHVYREELPKDWFAWGVSEIGGARDGGY